MSAGLFGEHKVRVTWRISSADHQLLHGRTSKFAHLNEVGAACPLTDVDGAAIPSAFHDHAALEIEDGDGAESRAIAQRETFSGRIRSNGPLRIGNRSGQFKFIHVGDIAVDVVLVFSPCWRQRNCISIGCSDVEQEVFAVGFREKCCVSPVI